MSFVREPLLFERFKAAGWSTALVTAKEKLTKLLRRGIDVCVDMKTHPAPHRTAAGAPPEIFSLEINLWVLRMAREVATRERPAFLYVATTDYPQHTLAPDEPEMQRYLAEHDAALGRLLDVYDPDDTLVVLTADHGMNAKRRSLSPVRVLADAGLRAHGLPLIRDGLYAHHRDLGGALYLYFEDHGGVDINLGQRGHRTFFAGLLKPHVRNAALRCPPSNFGPLLQWPRCNGTDPHFFL